MFLGGMYIYSWVCYAIHMRHFEVGDNLFAWTVLEIRREAIKSAGGAIFEDTDYMDLGCKCGVGRLTLRLEGPGPGRRWQGKAQLEHDCGCGQGTKKRGRPVTIKAKVEVLEGGKLVEIAPAMVKLVVEKEPARLPKMVFFLPTVWGEVDEWRKQNDVVSRSRAVEMLVMIGLEAGK